MKKELKQKGVSGNSKANERALLLSNAIKQAKNLGVSVNAHAPIEGKMFW